MPVLEQLGAGTRWLVSCCSQIDTMKSFRLRLEQALGSGAALALLSVPACGGSTAADASSAGAANGGGPGAVTAGSSGTANAGTAGAIGAGAAGDAGQQLMPYPESALGCAGPEYDGGYYGQCCTDALCYTPNDGGDCVAANAAPEKLGTFYGSGSCLCGDGIQGPFANNPTHQPKEPGRCCYVISSISCEGRPLLVDGTAVVSAPTRRSDWLLADFLESLT